MTKKPHLVGPGNISSSIFVLHPITPLPTGLGDVPHQEGTDEDSHQLPSRHHFD